MTDTLPKNAVGWVWTESQSLDPYAWVVRCPEHPPDPDERDAWKPLPAKGCPLELGGCFECDEFLL